MYRRAISGYLLSSEAFDTNSRKKHSTVWPPAPLLGHFDFLVYFSVFIRHVLVGGLGPDVYQLFVKGHGVFCNPASNGAPAKLRLAYEVAPIAFLVEAAGGRSSNGKCSALDVVRQPGSDYVCE